jgi:hypothetical protein
MGFFRIFAIFLVLIKMCGVKGQNTGSAQQKTAKYSLKSQFLVE